MAKILLTKKNVNEHISEDGKNIYITNSMIITPGAKDVLRNKGVMIVYGEKPEIEENKEVCQECVESSDLEDLQNMIVKILEKDFNITDKASINEACKLILDKVNTK